MAERIITESDLFEIKPPQLERTSYDFVTDEGFINSVPLGIRRMDLEFVIKMDVLDVFMNRWTNGTVLRFNIAGFRGTAYVTEIIVPCDALPVAKLRLTGPIVNTMEDKPMQKRTKVLNRFYVASDKMMSQEEQGTVNTGEPTRERYDGYERQAPRHRRWAKRDLSQAIDHAREILEQNPSKQEVAIVRIVKVVRRKAMPIIVEDVR